MEIIDKDDAVMVLVDLQGRLSDLVEGSSRLFEDTRLLLRGMRILGVPVTYTEQLPEKIGPTRPEMADLLEGCPCFRKSRFSCCGAEGFMEFLSETERRTIVLAGIEAHICICQTGLDLLDKGYRVAVVADAVSSRDVFEKELALARLREGGAQVVSLEMLLYELTADARDPNFRDILDIVKNRAGGLSGS